MDPHRHNHPPPPPHLRPPPPHLGPPPPPPHVHHTSHHVVTPPEIYPPPPTVLPVYPPPPHHHHPDHHHGHHVLDDKPTVKIHCRAETKHALSVRDGKVILAKADPLDPFQLWIKDEQFSAAVRDEEGLPSFALINKATRQAIKHSIAATQPVQLVPYDPKVLDESILWSESKDTGDGYRAIRMANNIRLNFDAFHGDKKHGGVHDGSVIVLWEWKKGDNQRWKIVPHCEFSFLRSISDTSFFMLTCNFILQDGHLSEYPIIRE